MVYVNWRGSKNYGYEQQREAVTMAGTLWCEINDPETNLLHQIGHPFPENDPNRETWTRTRTEQVQTGNSYGKPVFQDRERVTYEMDICGYHFAKQNPFQSNAPEVEASSADKTEEYLRGYKDGILGE